MVRHVPPAEQLPGGAGAKFTTPVTGEVGAWPAAVTVSCPFTRHLLRCPMMPAASGDGAGTGGSDCCLRQTGPGDVHADALAQFACLIPMPGFQLEQVASS